MGLQALFPHVVKPFCKIRLARSPFDLLAWPHSVESVSGLLRRMFGLNRSICACSMIDSRCAVLGCCVGRKFNTSLSHGVRREPLCPGLGRGPSRRLTEYNLASMFDL
jgi:hypothetical protein